MADANKKNSTYNIGDFKKIIRKAEGLSLIPYHLPNEKHWTIGYGHYGPEVLEHKQTKITKKRAEDLLDEDVKVRVEEIDNLIPDFKKFPKNVQNALFSEYYRGSLTYEGEGMDEKIYDQNGNLIAKINPIHFRPTAVDFLLGDATKAKTTLKWKPEHIFDNLVKVMTEADFNRINKGMRLQ